MIERSHHDMGGLPALCVLLWGLKGGKRRLRVDEHRKNIEALPPGAYDTMSYYERWTVSLAHSLIQRGIVTSEELARKMSEVEKRGRSQV